jgi:hypothetical protein
MATPAERDAMIVDLIEREPMPDKPPSKAAREGLPERLGMPDAANLAALLRLPISTVENYLEGKDPGILGMRLHRAVAVAEKVSPRS